jgi:hypothetical protein
MGVVVEILKKVRDPLNLLYMAMPRVSMKPIGGGRATSTEYVPDQLVFDVHIWNDRVQLFKVGGGINLQSSNLAVRMMVEQLYPMYVNIREVCDIGDIDEIEKRGRELSDTDDPTPYTTAFNEFVKLKERRIKDFEAGDIQG